MQAKRSLTNTFIGVITGAFLIAQYFPNLTNPPVQEYLFLINKAILSDGQIHGVGAGEWWRLLTVVLTHAGWLHLGSNMLALWSVGNPLEAFYGRAKFAAIFLVSLIAASLLSNYFNPANVPAVGASGAIFGLFGAMLVTGRRMGVNFQNIAGIIIVNLVITFTVPGIDWHAHVGGLLGGALVGYFLTLSKRT
jgi:membrane associated rhomboid family serine protease